MKIVKRDGRIVEYDADKIRIAINKANDEVEDENKVSEQQIDKIIKYIEKLNKKRMLVEDIQDIIEEKLMSFGKFDLAKHYIIYRYTRALVRKSNTTDQTILSIIKNNNEITNDIAIRSKQTVSTQRDLIAGEISKDLTKRMLLPEKISNAHEEGMIYFHDSDYFLQPMFNSSVINIEDMLNNTTVINGTIIESPNSFQVACNVTSQIIASVASGQYGNVTVDLSHLGKFLRKSFEKYTVSLKEKYSDKMKDDLITSIVKDRVRYELASGIQTLKYQINTLITTRGREPQVTFVLNLKQDEFIKENASIIEEVLTSTIKGVKTVDGKVENEQPKLMYMLTELNASQDAEYYHLTKLAIKCAKTRNVVSFVSAKKMDETFEGKVKIPIEDLYIPYKNENKEYMLEGRFNQGIVTVNLPRIGLETDENSELFFEKLDEVIGLCFEALMCRHHALLGTISDNSPIHFKYGAISRLESNEKIDKLLKEDYSTLSLGYVGLYELTKLMTGVDYTEEQGLEFAKKVLKRIKELCDRYRKETGLGIVLCGINSKNLCKHFAKIDRDKFGSIKDVTNKGYYTENLAIDKKQNKENIINMEFEENLASEIGVLNKLELNITRFDEEKLEEIVGYVYNNIKFVEFVNNKE